MAPRGSSTTMLRYKISLVRQQRGKFFGKINLAQDRFRQGYTVRAESENGQQWMGVG